MQVNCNPTQQLLFCIHLSHAFCRMRTPLSILPLSSQARKHSNHHTYRTPRRQVFTCLSHLSAVCKPGSRGIIFLDVAICLSIRTCLASELCVPTCQLCLPPGPSHTSPGALFLLHYMLSSQPSAFLPSHLTEENILSLPVSALGQLAGSEWSLHTLRCLWPPGTSESVPCQG